MSWRTLSYNGKTDLRYEINECGDVRTVRTGIIRKPIVKGGYKTITSRDGGYKMVCYYISRAVLCSFKGYKQGLEPRHINGNKLDSSIGNLEWTAVKRPKLSKLMPST